LGRFGGRTIRRSGFIRFLLRQPERAQFCDPGVHGGPFALDHLLELDIALVRCREMFLGAITRGVALRY
jgi:hypothetical protein